MKQKTKCRKCGTPITLDFEGLTYPEAIARMKLLNNVGQECPGFHVEISGWAYLWNFDDLLDAQYPGEHTDRFQVAS